jgi:signal transduction histidine kinase
MKITASERPALLAWFKKRIEGPHIFQWINYLMIFSVLVAFIIAPPDAQAGWQFYVVVLALTAVLVLNILWFQYHEQMRATGHKELFAWAFCLASDVLVLGSFLLTGREEVVFLVLMVVATFSSMFGAWPRGIIFALINLAITVGAIKGFGASDASLLQSGSQITVGMLFVMVFVLLTDRAQAETERAENLLKDLLAANLQLKAAHAKEKELAIAEERMRLARDIHDGLGHHLTVLSIQLQAAEKLVGRSPEEAAEAIRISRSEAQAALDEVRQSVGVMRQPAADSQPLAEVLAALVRDFGQHTALQIDFRQSGQPVELAAFARETLFRATQEGLTNVQKHGKNVTHITIRLEYTPAAVELVVQDNGQKPDLTDPHPADSFGLTGLRERLEQLGGSLHSGPGREAGFELAAHIPLEVSDDRRPAGR